MTLQEILTQAKDTATVKRVFGEPIERDGVVVIPAALVVGGGGGGEGQQPDGQIGGGGGFGVGAGPVGAYVIRDGDVRWIPAVNVTWLIAAGLTTARVAFRVLRSRRRRARGR